MGTKLYVGNLNYNTTEESLRALFGSNGREVTSVALIIDRETGRSRGFAFVELATSEQAQAALQELDGADLDGRQLRINEAREREARGPRTFGGPHPGGFYWITVGNDWTKFIFNFYYLCMVPNTNVAIEHNRYTN